MKFGNINPKLVPLKLLLFFLYAAIGCLPAFLTIHMSHIGLSDEEITWINTILPLVALGGPPLVGYIADRFGHYKLIAISSMFIAGVFHTALLFVPTREPTFQPQLQLACGAEGSSLVLKSCTGSCPEVSSHNEGKFRVENCRQECELGSHYCATTFSNSTRGTSLESFPTNPSDANICLHKENDVDCFSFGPATFIEVHTAFNNLDFKSREFSPSSPECCEFPLLTYTTTSASFFNLTCNPRPGCYVVCDVTETSNESYVLQSPVCTAKNSDPNMTFWLYMVIRTVADMFPAILISLFDAVVLTIIAKHGGDYGRHKMFGLFAIGTSAPVVGYLMDNKVGVHGQYDYAPVFYVFDVLLLITAIITLLLPLKFELKRTSMMKNLTQLVRTNEFNVLVFVVIVLGALNGFLEVFLYIFLVRDLGATHFLLGLTMPAGIITSLPFLYKSEPVVNYCGYHYLLILAFVGYCIRFAGLSYLENPYWVIPLEMLEVFTINLMQVTSAMLAYKLAPKTLVATAQGILWIAHFDIGRALGTFVGGYLITQYGIIVVFQGASVLSIVCAIIYLLIYQILKYKKAKPPKQLDVKMHTKQNGTVTNGSYVALPAEGDR